MRSTVLTSQLPVSWWHQQIGDPTLADGIPESAWFTMDIVSRCEAIGCARGADPSPRADGLVAQVAHPDTKLLFR